MNYDEWNNGTEESEANKAWNSEPEDYEDEDETLRNEDAQHWADIEYEVSQDD